MSGLLLVLLVALVLVILYQVGRAGEMISDIHGQAEMEKKRDNWMGYAMLGVLLVLMVGIFYTHQYMMPKTYIQAASDHGKEYDKMFVITLVVTGIVFFITQTLTFWFAFKYRNDGKSRAVFFAHSNKLEMIWTTIPALAMAVLVGFGLKAWFTMTSTAPENSMVVEVVGKQFNWLVRYPGADGKIGKRYFTNINEADNVLGLDWNDKDNADDIIASELHLVVDKPVELIIGSRDVIHDVGLAHFRMKMDAVPGITTRIWFTPTITTAKMREITKNPKFVYELSCDQMCGVGHYSMKALVIVETQEEYNKWIAEQKSYYATSHPSADTSKIEAPVAVVMDSTKH